ncbi:translation machinery-associated protein 16 [Coemansia sp. RSA 552]|nr:translation machinery-associated protein 16 [Coemansia sp. RSA 552]
MPNNKRKRVSKIKGKDKAHPYSRKARQISRAQTKEAQIARTKSDRISKGMAQGQKLVWFRDRIAEDDLEAKSLWSKVELSALVDEYLERNSEDVGEVLEKKKKGRALTPREILLLQVVETERKEARLAGVDVPDLTNGALVKTLRAWDGDLNSTSTIKLITCKSSSAPSLQAKQAAAPTKQPLTEEQAIAQVTGMAVD